MDKPHIVIAIIVACLLLILGLLVYRRRTQPPSLPLDQWFAVGVELCWPAMDVRT